MTHIPGHYEERLPNPDGSITVRVYYNNSYTYSYTIPAPSAGGGSSSGGGGSTGSSGSGEPVWSGLYNPETGSYAEYEAAKERWDDADYEYYSGGDNTPPGAPPPKPPGYDLWVASGRPGEASQWTATNPYAEGAEYADYTDAARALLPWLPDELVRIYAEQWAETGDRELALAYMRQSDAYDQYFAGNRRDDGSFRMSEQEYMATMDAYSRVFEDFGLNSNVFIGRRVELLEGEVSPQELVQRLGAAYEGIVTNIPQVREFYATQYGMQLSDAAIFASFIDPDVGDAILNRRISVAQIGGEGLARGLDVDLGFAERLDAGGVSQGQAREFFSQAEAQLPILERLVERHRDPDDSFDLGEFADLAIFGDSDQARRMRRLLDAEASTFTDQTGTIATQNDLTVSGLRPQ